MASPATLRRLLSETSIPPGLIDELLGQVGTPWMMGASDEVVAAEAVLCHPPLAPVEVRAVANPTEDPAVFGLTVVAWDRPGLLAGTAGALAEEGISVIDAAVTVLPSSRVAFQRVAVTAGDGALGDGDWERVGQRLREVLGRRLPVTTAWVPTPPVEVETQPQQFGRVLVTVRAPDRVGLLHAAATWFEARGCNVEVCHASSSNGQARDVFVVTGRVDPSALATALGGTPAAPARGGPFPLRLVCEVVKGSVVLPWRAAGLVGRAVTRR